MFSVSIKGEHSALSFPDFAVFGDGGRDGSSRREEWDNSLPGEAGNFNVLRS